MTFKLYFVKIILVLIFFQGQKLFSQKSHYAAFKSVSLLTDRSPDTCLLTCYVIETYTCPPCPPGAICKPCIGDNIRVGDTGEDKKNSMRLFTTDPGKYKIGKKYNFLINLHKTKEKQIYEAVLIKEIN